MALMMGYQPSESNLMIPAPPSQNPKPGNWRTRRVRNRRTGRERIQIRGCKRVDNTQNPLALGGRVFESVEDISSAQNPNAGMKRGIVNVLAQAVECGAVELSSLDPKMQDRVSRKIANL